ncbi:MAG: hypothetical protein R3E58_01755 [Phycisphaerae bacterium]
MDSVRAGHPNIHECSLERWVVKQRDLHRVVGTYPVLQQFFNQSSDQLIVFGWYILLPRRLGDVSYNCA